ncbi:MAG: hypothetical protein JJU02_12950 [Cryomorphaceae bacterium]|nr:hypothetical protein [Cryomorphaceae bacterium]
MIVNICSLSLLAQESHFPFDAYDDYTISEFELADGQVFRGRVIRVSPDNYYEIRQPRYGTRIIYESDVVRKSKVLPDMRDNWRHFDLGMDLLSQISSFGESITGLYSFNFGIEFGKSNQWHLTYGFGMGSVLFWQEPDFDDDQHREEFNTGNFQIGAGYKFNRMEKFSQSISAGGFFLYGRYPNTCGYLALDFPFKFSDNYLLVANLTYLQPMRASENPLLMAGVKIRIYYH